jgi:hypothetical protein
MAQDCLNNEDELESVLSFDGQITSDLGADDQLSSNIENVVEVSKTYTGAATDDIIVNVDNSKNEISATMQRTWFKTIYEFPAVGSENIIYGDIETRTLYIWDSDTVSYERLIGDWTEIETINGGHA